MSDYAKPLIIIELKQFRDMEREIIKLDSELEELDPGQRERLQEELEAQVLAYDLTNHAEVMGKIAAILTNHFGSFSDKPPMP